MGPLNNVTFLSIYSVRINQKEVRETELCPKNINKNDNTLSDMTKA